MTSGPLWIALIWIVIIGSRPVSFWFGGGIQIEKPEDYLDGSPLDRNIFILLILAGLIVLWRRRIEWDRIFASNRWLFIFFLYCGISVLWSDFPFVSFKRWFKDSGNVIMLLIIVTDQNPVQATKAVLARYTYVVVPLSLLFIKYFPEYGRYYIPWTWEPAFCGITTNKNELGCAIFIGGLFLVWELIYMRSLIIEPATSTPSVREPSTSILGNRSVRAPRRHSVWPKVADVLIEAEMHTTGSRNMDKKDLLGRAILLVLALWLIIQVGSSTAQACLVLGTCVLLVMQFPFAQRQVRYLGSYTAVLIFLILILYTTPSILESFVQLMGRDMTLTGRTDVWTDLLSIPIDPVVGTGYQSFWLGPYAVQMWEKYTFHPNQAHNGYLETYLHGGLVGVCLLIAMIISAGSKLKTEVVHGDGYGIFRLTLLGIAMFYNWTEAFFNKLSPVWIIVLLAALSYPRQAKAMANKGINQPC
jgi:O-antigen ligase